MESTMNSISGAKRSISSTVVAIVSFALVTQIATSYKTDQQLSTSMQNGQNTTVPKALNNTYHILSNPFPHNETYHLYRSKRETLPYSSPISNSNAISTVQNLIIKLQADLTQLSMNANDILTTNITTLVKTTIELDRSIIRLKKELADKDIAYNKKMMAITQKFNRVLLSAIVESIQSRKFSLAEHQLLLSDDIKYEDVVPAVCNQNAEDIHLLQRFGDYILNVEHKFAVFNALFQQMKIIGRRDVFKLIRLHQSLKKDVLGRTANTTGAQTLIDAVENEIPTSAVESISASFLNDYWWPSIHSLATSLFDNFPQFLTNINNKVIDRVFDTLGAHKIIKEAKKINHTESEMLILQAVFEKLQSKGELNTNPSISLARSMKTIMNYTSYQNVSSSWKTPFESMKNELPESVKNLVFSSTICIKNSLYDEYLYASDIEHGGYGSDDQRRSVYTGVSENQTILSAFKWKVNFTDDFQIILYNNEFNEKLFGCYYLRFNNEKEIRMAFTYRGIGTLVGTGNRSLTAWNPEVDGEALQLKNDQSKEYLFADSERKESDGRRYVFTYTPGSRIIIGSKWEIIDCS